MLRCLDLDGKQMEGLLVELMVTSEIIFQPLEKYVATSLHDSNIMGVER